MGHVSNLEPASWGDNTPVQQANGGQIIYKGASEDSRVRDFAGISQISITLDGLWVDLYTLRVCIVSQNRHRRCGGASNPLTAEGAQVGTPDGEPIRAIAVYMQLKPKYRYLRDWRDTVDPAE